MAERTKLKPRQYVFLRDVFLLAITAYGGPQAHLALFLEKFVEKRRYLTEKELVELIAMCQILPGPSSTQTITAIGYKRGGAFLAFLTLIVWAVPAVTLMITFAIVVFYLGEVGISVGFTRVIQPMAVSFVAYAAFKIFSKVVNTKTGYVIMAIAAVTAYNFRTPWAFPIVLLMGGLVTSYKFPKLEKEEKQKMDIQWGTIWVFLGTGAMLAILGAVTRWMPILLTENFYRNGSLIFGGGQVLIPAMFNEFVEAKAYLSKGEFLTGYSLVQSVPGPVFSFASYVGALSMREYGTLGGVLGGLAGAVGIFLPGTLLIFFMVRFWEQLKKYRPIKASLEGVNAASAGLMVSAFFLLLESVESTAANYTIILIVFLLLYQKLIPAPMIIISGLLLGLVMDYTGLGWF